MKNVRPDLGVSFLLLFLSLTVTVSSSFARETSGYGHYAPSAYSNKVVLLDWNTPDGLSRLVHASYTTDFYQLAHHYQPQQNGLYCGVASSVIVLNALRAGRREIPSQQTQEISVPPIWGGGSIPYTLYAQASFFDEHTEQVKPRAVVEFRANAADGKPNPGLMLQELRDMLEAHGVDARAQYADADEMAGVVLFREVLRATLGESEHFLIVNYDSQKIGQAGGGHISPLGAYDSASDSVLILDVSGQFNPWVWTPVRDLYLAMHTQDGAKYRGWVVVSEGSTPLTNTGHPE
ncbi:putative Glutathione gamma-glutamylcysteinyltransferase [Gammaproteobacteria bacterium]